MGDSPRQTSSSRSAERVRRYLEQHGLDGLIVEFDRSTKTAALAADAVGCEVGQIVKSLVFIADGEPVLALVAGDRRGDPEAIAASVGASRARMANAEEVRSATGYAIGGVSPFDLPESLMVLVDDSLSRFAHVFAAAGTPESVVPIEIGALLEMTNGRVGPIAT